MQRTPLSILFLLLAGIFTFASAGQRPVTSGDPSIDAQWQQFSNGANPVGSDPIDPNSAPATGIFSGLGGTRSSPAASRGQARAAPVPTIDAEFLPKLVEYPSDEHAGTIVIDTSQRYLYYVLEGGKAQRYGVGVGREGFGWHGSVEVGRKAEWPTWVPPVEMRQRQPDLPLSMAGGPNNPLGARALYLFDGGRDTLFRIHGSNEPWTIGHAVSSGCIRMRNEDVIQLYGRVGIGTKVIVL